MNKPLTYEQLVFFVCVIASTGILFAIHCLVVRLGEMRKRKVEASLKEDQRFLAIHKKFPIGQKFQYLSRSMMTTCHHLNPYRCISAEYINNKGVIERVTFSLTFLENLKINY